MNKPDYISAPDWKILIEKYSEKKLEKYLQKNYPYQYLIGNVDFFNSNILINNNVLIPRWETEELVNRIVHKLSQKKYTPHKGLDLCTGSGCIAISLSKSLNVGFDAIDISRKALKIAKKNVQNNKVNVMLIKSDVLKNIPNGKYDLIVCNPPYVKIDEPVGLETRFEPQKAIFANKNGLEFYECILKYLKQIVNKYYFIAFEFGANQKESLFELAIRYFNRKEIHFEKDLNKKDRYLFISNIE